MTGLDFSKSLSVNSISPFVKGGQGGFKPHNLFRDKLISLNCYFVFSLCDIAKLPYR
jgi:hypothetical protein